MRSSSPVAIRPGSSGLAVAALAIVCSVVLSVGTGKLASYSGSLRLSILCAAAVAVVGIGFGAPRTLVLLLPIWFVALGLLRRLVTLDAGSTERDLLLLVGPLALAVLVLVGARASAFRRPSGLGHAVFALAVLALLGAINPLQGSVAGGIAGLLFVLVPMLGFWIGRSLVDDDTLAVLLRTVAALAIAAAAYGLGQTFLGFPNWDTRWIQTSGYVALTIGADTVRPFSSFSSATEYGYFLAVGVVVWIALGLRRRPVLAVAAAGLLVTGLVYESSRAVAVLLVLALGLMAGARRGVSMTRAFALAVIVLVAVSVGLRHVVTNSSASGPGALVAHQVGGLANPFSVQSSSAVGHLSLLVDGFRSAITDPIGQGVGAVTISSSKFGGIERGTELDPSNAGVALGLPGLVAYLVVLVLGLRLAYRRAAARRDGLSLATLGIVVALLFQWLNGGQYAVAFLPWLLLGWADARESDPKSEAGS